MVNVLGRMATAAACSRDLFLGVFKICKSA